METNQRLEKQARIVDQSSVLSWKDWRQERAFRVGRLYATLGTFLSFVATAVNYNYLNMTVVYADLVLIFGGFLSIVLTERQKERYFVWWPMYLGYWFAINVTIGQTGGVYSVFLGPFLCLLYVGGVVVQNTFRPLVILVFTLLNFFFWTGMEFFHPLQLLSSQPIELVVMIDVICIGAIALGILGFLRTERELAWETRQRYSELYQTRVSLEREEAANASKSSFLANISHELRTPLSAIVGFADLIRDPKTTNSEKVKFADTILRNGELLAHLVDDLLDLSKVEAGKLEVEGLIFSPRSLFAEVIDLMMVRALEKNLDLKLAYRNEVPRALRSDPVRFKQILMNVIGNAIKFTAKGSIHVSVQYHTSGHLIVEVKDTGRGMTDEEQKRLFQPFTQADASMARKYGGTGLGLSLSRRLARLLGGDLVLSSTRLDHGSVFTISIAAAPTDGAQETTETAPPIPRKQNALDQVRILVVDDTFDNQELLKHYLLESNAIVDSASNGLEAVQKATLHKYDIILMDIQMPGMDGLQATSTLRAQGCTTPILALTAHAMPVDRTRCLESGCNDYLSKPFKKNDLIAKIEALL